MDWYRWWHGSSTDPKFQMVAIECGMPLSCVLGLWAVLLEKASEANPRGSFQIDHEVLSFQLGIDTVTPCNAMQRRGLLHVTDETLQINSWEKRQPKRERDDNSTERVRACRERKKQNETPCNANVTQETPRLDKRREEINTYTPEFEQFWSAWPSGGRKGGRKPAYAAWKKLKLDGQVNQIIKHVLADISTRDEQFRPAPASYLNKMPWDGWEPASVSNSQFGAGNIV